MYAVFISTQVVPDCECGEESDLRIGLRLPIVGSRHTFKVNKFELKNFKCFVPSW